MGLPFAGLRIIDLTRVWAGPAATRFLADLGAEVIKVEALGSRPVVLESASIDFNRNKLSLAVDLSAEAGRNIFKRLVAISDIVVENFSPRVMGNFKLDYPVLRQINPSLIMLSMPGFGMSGPCRDYVSYGSTLESQSGMCSLIGYQDSEPLKSGNALTDPIASVNGATALLIALWHRRQAGEGQFIELAQLEGATCQIGEYVVGYGLTGELPKRLGNRHAHMAPQGCYPCQGEDRWVAISVSSNEEWRSLCQVLGKPEMAIDERYADEVGRWCHHDELDEILGHWTMTMDQYEAMRVLQGAGIAAGAVLDAPGMLHDPHLRECNYFWELPHQTDGTYLVPGLPIHFSTFETGVHHPPPLLGEHSRWVLSNLLGLSEDEASQLEKGGVISSPLLT